MPAAGIRFGNTTLTVGVSMIIVLLVLGGIWYYGNGNGNGGPDEVPLAIQQRCVLDNRGFSAEYISEKFGEGPSSHSGAYYSQAVAFFSFSTEAEAKEFADVMKAYSWYKLGGNVHGPHDIKGNNINQYGSGMLNGVLTEGTGIVDVQDRSRYSLGRYVYMPGQTHDDFAKMLYDNADKIEGLCK